MHKDAKKKIAFIQSCWHKDIVDRCRDGFAARLDETGSSQRLNTLKCLALLSYL